MMQLTIEMTPADTSKMVCSRPKETARTYRFDMKPASLVDQVALTTDYRKSEFVADSIVLGALFIRIAGAEALRLISSMQNPAISAQLENLFSSIFKE